MNTRLQRKNILKIEIFYNIILNYKKYSRDNEQTDLEIISILVDGVFGSGTIHIKTKVNTFGLIVSNYFFKPDNEKRKLFLFSKKRVRFFKDGRLNAKSIYYKQKCI